MQDDSEPTAQPYPNEKSEAADSLTPREAHDWSVDPEPMASCPICGAGYLGAFFKPPCSHFITDHCWSTYVDTGNERGSYASGRLEVVMIEAETIWREIGKVLQEYCYDIEDFLPEEWKNTEYGDWFDIDPTGYAGDPLVSVFQQRLAAAPGYFGATGVESGSLAGDYWEVHWAADGKIAADWVAERMEGMRNQLTELLSRLKQLQEDE